MTIWIETDEQETWSDFPDSVQKETWSDFPDSVQKETRSLIVGSRLKLGSNVIRWKQY